MRVRVFGVYLRDPLNWCGSVKKRRLIEIAIDAGVGSSDDAEKTGPSDPLAPDLVKETNVVLVQKVVVVGRFWRFGNQSCGAKLVIHFVDCRAEAYSSIDPGDVLAAKRHNLCRRKLGLAFGPKPLEVRGKVGGIEFQIGRARRGSENKTQRSTQACNSELPS